MGTHQRYPCKTERSTLPLTTPIRDENSLSHSKSYKQSRRYNLTFTSSPTLLLLSLLCPLTNHENLRPDTLANLRYRLIAKTGGYTIEQLERVSIRLLKYLTDRPDDPIAIPASRDFQHTAHASTSDIRESRGIGGSGFGPA